MALHHLCIFLTRGTRISPYSLQRMLLKMSEIDCLLVSSPQVCYERDSMMKGTLSSPVTERFSLLACFVRGLMTPDLLDSPETMELGLYEHCVTS